ncbi:hypothetical protein COY27_01515 [Candidatus Woesearchaeota archaeon CG_4_10_14_0_2_um_filter_33_13]|nr:MAG: hypothetical protein COY27_01515 [Candidatus Woesearchaeota archaeon CG_4_10_14_0_2_um_filter_33_13]
MKFSAMVHQLRVLTYIIIKIKNWPEFLYAHLRKSKRLMVVTLRGGLKVLVRPYMSDVTMLMETWGMEDYTPPGFKIRSTDIVFDIGGHIGSFSMYAAIKATKGKVYSFEPLPENYQIFKSNIEQNKLSNIHLEQKAVSDKGGVGQLFLCKGTHSGSSSLFYRNTKDTVSIKRITLTDFFEKYKISKVDFMKIDCEGAEYDILFSLPKKQLSKIKRISMEYHDTINHHTHRELIHFFKNNGFKTRLSGEMIYAIQK